MSIPKFSAKALRRPNAVKLVELLKAKKGPLKPGGRTQAARLKRFQNDANS